MRLLSSSCYIYDHVLLIYRVLYYASMLPEICSHYILIRSPSVVIVVIATFLTVETPFCMMSQVYKNQFLCARDVVRICENRKTFISITRRYANKCLYLQRRNYANKWSQNLSGSPNIDIHKSIKPYQFLKLQQMMALSAIYRSLMQLFTRYDNEAHGTVCRID